MAKLKLKITYQESGAFQSDDNYDYRNKPFAHSKIFKASMEKFEILTKRRDVKTTYQITLNLQGEKLDFLPGDVVGVLPQNNQMEVEDLLRRLNLETLCHNIYTLEITENLLKKKAAIPKHLPPNSTLHETFLKYIDIRTPPKKLFLKSLIEYTENSKEKEELEEICSPSGSDKYIDLLMDKRSLLLLLNAFPSCHPPIELILEHSTPLNPRYYSIASSPLKSQLSLVFYKLSLPNGLKGVCSGWLEEIIRSGILNKPLIPIYLRTPGDFRFVNVNAPTIMVATGTGIAPFLGFLQHKAIIGANSTPTLLFYGCCYPEDLFFENEIESYLKEGVLTKLFTAFSRKKAVKVYVQNRLLEQKEEICHLIFNKEAVVYLCCDFKSVMKSVQTCFIECFMQYGNQDRSLAEKMLNSLMENKRYVVNSWM